MSYTALYRKWRPKNFDSVVGQQHIVKTLKNQIQSNRIGHAYLFCGTRGTGKTSTAKIFAKAVNCINPSDGEPCNECEACKNISSNRSMNIIEIDAASNNGVDNIREINEEVKYPPTEGKYKVYIIDEVHMLSIGAFNALLKTLEEPPKHIIFILATTDPQKIPVTILSRCQRYDFRRISIKDMVSKLNYYMKQENIVVEDKALKYIANLSDGAMRDAINILDQCIAFYYGEQITLQKVLDTVGAVDTEIFYSFADSLMQKNSVECINIIDEVINCGRDIRQFVTDFIVHLRNLLITKNSKSNILNLSDESINKLLNQAKNTNDNTLMEFIKEFSDLELKLKYTGNNRIFLEILVIKLCNQQKIDLNIYNSLLDRISKLEVDINKKSNTAPNILQSKPNEIPKPKIQAIPEDIKNAINLWEQIKLEFSYAPLSASLQLTNAGYLNDSYYYIICPDEGNYHCIEKHLNELSQALEQKTGKVFQLKLILSNEFNFRYSKIYGTKTDNDDISKVLNKINPEGIVIEQID